MQNVDEARRPSPQRSTEPRAAQSMLSAGIGKRGIVGRSLAVTVLLASLGVAMQAPAANRQQERMKSCNAQAKSQALSGAERKDFVKRCLGGQDAASEQGLNSQQRKMKSCSAEAKSKGLKGSDRSHFMSGCLKSSS